MLIICGNASRSLIKSAPYSYLSAITIFLSLKGPFSFLSSLQPQSKLMILKNKKKLIIINKWQLPILHEKKKILIFYKTLLRWLIHNWHWINSINKSVYLLKEMGQSKISLLSWSIWYFHGIRFPFKHLQAHSKMLLPWESCDGSQINMIIRFYSFIISTF